MDEDQFTRNVPAWFKAESWIEFELVLAYMAPVITDILNPDLVGVIQVRAILLPLSSFLMDFEFAVSVATFRSVSFGE